MTTKQKLITLILTGVCVLITFAGCPDQPKSPSRPSTPSGPSGPPQETPTRADREFTITDLFDEGFSAKVVGKQLTTSEWSGVANKIKDALNGAFDDANPGLQLRFTVVFDRLDGVTIIVERNPSPTYANWKTTGDGVTLHLNLAALDGIESELPDAIRAMHLEETEMALIIDQSNVRLALGVSHFDLVSGT